MTLDEQKRLCGNYRGRRYLTCRAIGLLDAVVEAIGEDDGTVLDSEKRTLPAISDAQRNELQNLIALTLRMILVANDGQISPHQLRRF